MNLALKEAEKAFKEKEVPVGAIISKKGELISQAHNTREKNYSPLAHAEILAIYKASRKLQSWRLEDCSIYVSLEPCLMCVGAILQARLSNLFYACPDPKKGFSSYYKLDKYENWNQKLLNISYLPLFEQESSHLLKSFFKKLR